MNPQAVLRAMEADTHSTELDALLPSFKRHLLARARSPRTVQSYEEAVAKLTAFLIEQDMPTDLESISRRHIEAFELDLLERYAPSTVANRHRSLGAFFKWCLHEGELADNPMDGLAGPKVPPKPVHVLTPDELRRFLDACTGPTFRDVRDTAIARLLIDTGMRLGEIANLTHSDGLDYPVDLDGALLHVVGKGQKPRLVPIGTRTVSALDRYLRARRRHRNANEKALWLGKKGPMTDSGIGQMVSYRSRIAGLKCVHPHMFRHTFASQWLESGGSEGDLMKVCGWSSREMLDRYGATEATRRAVQAHRRLSPGDRL